MSDTEDKDRGASEQAQRYAEDAARLIQQRLSYEAELEKEKK